MVYHTFSPFTFNKAHHHSSTQTVCLTFEAS